MQQLKKWSLRLIIVSATPIVSFGSRFARNVILSRLLVPEEFGTALALAVVVALGGLVTDVALDRFVMINDSARALSTAHALSILRAVLVAAAMVAGAPVLAGLFGVENASQSFAIAGALSAISGFAHLGIKQIQRHYEYLPQTIAQVAASLIAIIALFLGISALHDHRAIIVSYAAELSVYVIASHLLARTFYKVNWEKSVIREALSFGIPLTVNGLGLAIIYQLDRTLVGYWFGVKELASYAIVLSVSVVPVNLILAGFSNIGMSYILTEGKKITELSKRYKIIVGIYAVICSIYVLWLALSLDIVTPVIFGNMFTVDPSLHFLLIIISVLRLQRGGAPTTLLLATSRTNVLAMLNLSAGVGLICAWICLIVSPRIESMLVGIAIGELIAFALSFVLTEKLLKPRGEVFGLFFRTLAAPVFITTLFVFFPVANWSDREVILGGGLLAIVLQLALERHKNGRFPFLV